MGDTTRGRSRRNVSHCASKSGSATSPALAGTAGPHDARKVRIRASASASRRAGGSGIHVFSWNGPAVALRTRSTHAAISSGWLVSAPIAPMPPARATAIESSGALAPAIGARRIGTRSP